MGLLPGFEGLQNIPATTVIQGQRQRDRAVVRSQFLRICNQCLHPGVKFRYVTNHPQTHPLGTQFADFFLQVELEQTHEGAHLFHRAAPVFGAEGEKCQVLHAALGTGSHNGTHFARTHRVPCRLGQTARTGPAAVAIHNDGDVLR